MLSIIYIIGCIVAAVLSYYLMRRDSKPQEYFTAADAMLTLWTCVLSWVGVVMVLFSLDWTDIKLWKLKK